MRDMKIGAAARFVGGFTPVLEADVLINSPIAKHHS
jgi:hypothetical protein